MTITKAELSSLETAIRELGERVTTSADELLGTLNEDVAVDLYGVERSLRMARRQIVKATETLRE
jgi:hypothetical protein